jgi:hypothetical protein
MMDMFFRIAVKLYFFVNTRHVGASCISLAPTFFKSQSALIPLLLLSKPQPLCPGENACRPHVRWFTASCGFNMVCGFADVWKNEKSPFPALILCAGQNEFALHRFSSVLRL